MHCRNYNYSRNIFDLYENKKCELNYLIIISLDYTYYDIFLRIQRAQSINKQIEYDNLILEQHILSKKN